MLRSFIYTPCQTFQKSFISAPMPSAYLAYNIFMNRLAIYARYQLWFRSQTVDKGEEKSFNKTS